MSSFTLDAREDFIAKLWFLFFVHFLFSRSLNRTQQRLVTLSMAQKEENDGLKFSKRSIAIKVRV